MFRPGPYGSQLLPAAQRTPAAQASGEKKFRKRTLVTYIPAENNPRKHQHSEGNADQLPTEAISTDTQRITASSDPNATRPMPSARHGVEEGSRYELSADPVTTTLEPIPWQEPVSHVEHTAPMAYAPAVPASTPAAFAPVSSMVDTRRRDISFGIVVGSLLRLLVLGTMAWGITIYALNTVNGQWADDRGLQEGEQLLSQLPALWAQVADLTPVVIGLWWAVFALLVATGSKRWVPLGVGLVCGLGAIITVQLLKRDLLAKAPYGIQETTMNSLPSGHTAAAAAAALVAILTTPASWRGFIAFLSALTSAVAGFSTVLNGWHRPMDAMVSVLVVACWGVAGAILIRSLTRPERYAKNSGMLLLMLAGVLLIAAAGALAIMQTSAMTGLPLFAGGAGILGFSVLAAHQVLRAARPQLPGV